MADISLNINHLLGLNKGKSIVELAKSINQDNPEAVLDTIYDPQLMSDILKALPGSKIADFCINTARLLGSFKFAGNYSENDLDCMFELLRIAFVAGIFYEKHSVNRSWPNNWSSDKAK